MLLLFVADMRLYLCSDSSSKSNGFYNSNDNTFSIKNLNSISASRVPNNLLLLKYVGAPIMIHKNMDHSAD